MSNPFTPVRFIQEPLTLKTECQTLYTWGDSLRQLYPDFWGWAGKTVNYMEKTSVARPVVWEIVQ